MLELNKKTIFLLVAMPTTAVLLYWLMKTSREGRSSGLVGCHTNNSSASLLIDKNKTEDTEDEEDEKVSVVTSRQTTIELAIPKKAVGAVIGRQGQTIKEMDVSSPQDDHAEQNLGIASVPLYLQEKSGAKINFKDNSKTADYDRILVIRGTPEAAQSAECLVRKIIADMPVIVQAEITVPAHCLGRIIGRNGESIRQMSRASKTKIYVDRTQDDYRDKPRVITISGAKQQIDIAKSLIQEKLDEEEAYRARTAVSAANRERRKGHPSSQHQSLTREGDDNHKKNNKSDPEIDERGEGEGVITLKSTPWPQNKEYVEVYVSAVANPGIFWVQIVSSLAIQLDEMTTQMSRHFGEQQKMPLESVKVGDYVAAPFENNPSWYRAKVMDIKGEELDLFYVDYGDSGYLTKDKVRPLSTEYLQLPMQSIECRLAHVKPNGDQWSDESIIQFEDLTHSCRWKVLMAKAESYTGKVPHLRLVDTNTETDININEEIVKRGFGVWET